MKTVIALYDNLPDARQAIEALRASNHFTNEDISLMAYDADNRYSQYLDDDRDLDDDDETMASEGAKTGAGIGAAVGAIGGLLVGLGVFAIPGVGPVVAAGPLVATLVGAAGGAAAGGIVGALIGAGIPEEHAHYYAEGVRRGGSLVAVRSTDTTADDAATILGRFNPVDVEKRAEHWRSQGWSGKYDKDADPYTHEGIRNEYDSYPDEVRTTGEAPYIRTYSNTPYKRYEKDYRTHFSSNAPAGGNYDDYSDAYRFGTTLGTNDRFRRMKWNDMEAEAHKNWAKSHDAGAWDKVKNYVQYAWHKTKAQGYDATLDGNNV